jgi:hypothetical protein
MTYNSDVISIPSPLLTNLEDIGIAEAIYEMARKLYLGNTVDIERENGRILALDLTLHKSLLEEKKKIEEIVRTIGRIKPRGLKIKITDMPDLRNESRQFQINWVLLMKSIGAMSFLEGFPIFYPSANVDGLIAQMCGIDCFIQTFNRNDIDREIKLPAETIKKLREANPQITSGRISQYNTKEFIIREDFENIVKTGWPYPMTDIAAYDYQTIKNMTQPRFRLFAKELLVAQRNFEINEIKNAIENEEGIRLLKGKFGKGDKTLNLLS